MGDPTRDGSRLVAEVAEAERAERTRLADRLHDEGLQLVLAARQELGELRDGDPTALDALELDLEQASEALRSLTSAMHEDILTTLPLAEALERIGGDAARRGRFAHSVAVDDEATDVHDALVRDIARELLANAARHAQAASVAVEVRAIDGSILVRVSDDGRGLDQRSRVEAERSGHVGLGRLERNVGELGGRFAVESEPGEGTVASVWLPREALAAQGSLEDALRGERRWTAALLASLQDGLIVFRDHEVVQVNDAFCTMTGFGRDALLGTTPETYPFWREQDREQNMLDVEDAHARRGVDQVVELLRASGGSFPALCSSARIDDPTGGEIGMLVTVKDLTERKRAAERRRMEVELRTTIETTRRVTALLMAVEDGVPALLEALGRLLVGHLGWGNVVVNLRSAHEDRWEVAWTSSASLAAALQGSTQCDADWAQYLDPRFARRGAYFVAAGEVEHDTMAIHVPDWRPDEHAEAWQAHDMLLIPLRRPGRTLCGLISVDCPDSFLRPTDTELDALVAAGEHAACALGFARRAV